MARTNYAYAKRQRELAKKQKKEAKRLRKAGSSDSQPQGDQAPPPGDLMPSPFRTAAISCMLRSVSVNSWKIRRTVATCT